MKWFPKTRFFHSIKDRNIINIKTYETYDECLVWEKKKHHVSQGSTDRTPPPPFPPCSCHQLPRPDLGGETLTYPQTWEWGEKGVGSALRWSETRKTARLLMTASHPSQHVISFIPWSALSSHHLYNYAKCLPFVGHTSHLQHPWAKTFKT